MKLFYMGKRLKDVYPYATKMEMFKFRAARFVRSFVLVSVGFGIIYGAIHFGRVFAGEEIIYIKDPTLPAVLVRIAKCESSTGHYDKNGQVSLGPTKDIGKYMIHIPTWGKKAHEMGLDLSKESDNEEFAKWLYETRGTVDWEASRKCWNK